MSKTKKALASLAATSAALLIAGGLSGSASAWGPERPTYTNDLPADHATFNSITDNVKVGDERNFVRISEAGQPYSDEVEIVPGKEYDVYIYYHNNAASNTNETGYGMATDVKVASAYPTILNPGERGIVSGIISWSYVDPSNDKNGTGKVWDEAFVTTQYNDVILRYKTGTATIHNDGAANGSILSTNLFTEDGTYIGYNQLTGVLPGCAEYSGYITYTLVAEKTDVSLDKKVSVDGENWFENVSARPGDVVTYKVEFKNTGNTDLTNVIFKDTHDDGLSLYSGSTKIFNYDNQDGKVIGDILDISGYNTGDAMAGDLVQIIYQSRIASSDEYCDKTLNNTITANYNSTESIYDEATVTVYCGEGPVPTPGPTPTPEPTPDRIVNTGPVEIVMAVIVVLGIAGGGFYLYRTRKTLKTVEKGVSGKATESEATAKSAESSQEASKTTEKADEPKSSEPTQKA